MLKSAAQMMRKDEVYSLFISDISVRSVVEGEGMRWRGGG
jgi:hypothetical protein